jgi:hypothetical protein
VSPFFWIELFHFKFIHYAALASFAGQFAIGFVGSAGIGGPLINDQGVSTNVIRT